jgi:hypothetical protein
MSIWPSLRPPKRWSPYAAVGTINAAIIALATAFSDRGIQDGVQVNSVLWCRCLAGVRVRARRRHHKSLVR